MSQSIEPENAKMLLPLTEISSFSRYITWISAASSATNNSPAPLHVIICTPSPVIFDLMILFSPPDPLLANFTSP